MRPNGLMIEGVMNEYEGFGEGEPECSRSIATRFKLGTSEFTGNVKRSKLKLQKCLISKHCKRGIKGDSSACSSANAILNAIKKQALNCD